MKCPNMCHSMVYLFFKCWCSSVFVINYFLISVIINKEETCAHMITVRAHPNIMTPFEVLGCYNCKKLLRTEKEISYNTDTM